MSTQYATDTLQYLSDDEYKNDDEALDAIDEANQMGQRSAVVPLLHYADSVGMSDADRRALLTSIEGQYVNGKSAADGLQRVS
ncbi:hypothetical protein NKH18_19470 [Streptomyces sp. M10(2022)]